MIKTILTDEVLTKLNFKNNGKCELPLFENMHYWVKNGVCLFYNTPVSDFTQQSYYVGYAEMRQSKYVAVAFKWIDTVEELTSIYNSITNKIITDVF